MQLRHVLLQILAAVNKTATKQQQQQTQQL